jgi:hypothetical protein
MDGQDGQSDTGDVCVKVEDGPAGYMETRKRLEPSADSALGTGVTRDSEARDPMGGEAPRLGGGARR